MATPVIMPRQGQSVESCIITKWHKRAGDAVAVGELLFTYETDKATFDEEAKEAGTLLAAFFNEGDDVPCLLNVCVIGQPGENAAQFAPEGSAGAAPAGAAPAQAAPAAAASAGAAPAQAASAGAAPAQAASAEIGATVAADISKISPRARALAERTGADLSRASASGPDGRVIARDVQSLLDQGAVVTPAARAAYAGGAVGTGLGGRVTLADAAAQSAGAAPAGAAPAGAAPAGAAPATAAPAAPATPVAEGAEFVEEPLTHMRKSIAKAMHASLSSMAQLTHNASYDATQLLALRKQFKDTGAPYGLDKVTLNDIILYAVSRTLTDPAHRALNAHFLDDRMKYFTDVHLGIAVDTDRGLMVPTLRFANRKSLAQISQESKQLAKDCQAGSISPDSLRGASFTISNLGALEIETFTPVINPPQTGILGVNTITTRVRDVNGAAVPYPAMRLSLTYDHRALDGAPASRFLRDLKHNLENITLLLARG